MVRQQQGRAAVGVLRHERLVHPALEVADEPLGEALVAGRAVALGQDAPLGMAAQLPRPFLVLVEGGVDEPIHLALELVRRAARDQLARQDALAGLLGRLALFHEVRAAELALDAEKALRLQRAPHLGREQPAGGGEIAVRDRVRDAFQAGARRVDRLPKEVRVAQPRADHLCPWLSPQRCLGLESQLIPAKTCSANSRILAAIRHPRMRESTSINGHRLRA